MTDEETEIVLPGDCVNVSDMFPVKIGPGLLQYHENIIATKAGSLLHLEKGNRWWYVPAMGDFVVGTVVQKGADNYKVDIASAHAAVLPVLAFEGATKRNRPILEIGSTVFARVSFAHRDIEPELECVNPATNKADGFGELKDGHVFKCSLSLARSLLVPKSPLLKRLSKHFTFEIAVGLNGRVWINSSSPKHIIIIMNAIKKSEFIPNDQMKPMIKELLKLVDKMETD